MNGMLVSNKKQLDEVFTIRKKVFVNEQNIPLNIEIDEHEDEAKHFLLFKQNVPIGAGRLRFIEDYGKVERICILKDHRHSGAGSEIMKTIEQYAKKTNINKLVLYAQNEAIPFYLKLGYSVTSGEFLDAGIPHHVMEKHFK